MNTPDNRPEAVLDRILEKAGVIPPHTPDTEWERQLRIDFEVAYGRMPENFEHVPSVHISDWWLEKLSSHTTHWKERVKEKDDLLDDMWGLICNVNGGIVEDEKPDWYEAFFRIREKYFKQITPITNEDNLK